MPKIKNNMKNTLILFLLILLELLPFTISCQNSVTNLVQNSGFENGEGENPDGWVTTVFQNTNTYFAGIDNDESYEGKKSYKFSRIWKYGRGRIKLESETPIEISPGNKYLLSFWYKTEGINEYSESFDTRFVVESDSTPPLTYQKKIFNVNEWNQYFILLDILPNDAKSLKISFNTNILTKGSIWLDDIKFFEASKKDIEFFEQWRRQSISDVAGSTDNKAFKATGFYRVEKADDRWWIVDPNGNPTWGLGISGSPSPKLGEENPITQTEWFKNNYGNNRSEVNNKLYDIFMKESGFNSFAGWTSDEHALITKDKYSKGENFMSMTRVLGLSSATDDPNVFAKDRENNLLNKSGHEVVDPFNPEWKNKAREKAEKIISQYKDEPWFFGWFVDNEMSFEELYRYIWAQYSSLEFLKMLKDKYSSINLLNKSWSSKYNNYQYSSFEEILEVKPEPVEWDDPVWKDFSTFERIMMKEYIDFTYNLVKELDPNHLVISNRINLGPMPAIYRTIDLWGKYDIVCMNIYPDNNMIGFNPGEIEIMKMLHKGSNRPIIIGEWSVPAIDSKLYEFGKDPYDRPLDWSWPQVLRTQKERGEAYKVCIKQLASLDFIIGAGWFITYDVDNDKRRSNRGIINNKFELYQELVDSMKSANDDIKRAMKLQY